MAEPTEMKAVPPLGDVHDEDPPDIEIVGLTSGTNGRSCTLHEICGNQVGEGNIVRLVRTILPNAVSGGHEDAIKCVLIGQDGEDACIVGFIPRAMVHLPQI